jgi:hypothetical protein
MLVVTLGGVRSARRAARTPPIQSLREPELPDRRMVTAGAGAWAVGGFPAFGAGAAAAVAGTGLLLTLAATVLPTALAVRRDIPRTLAAE